MLAYFGLATRLRGNMALALGHVGAASIPSADAAICVRYSNCQSRHSHAGYCSLAVHPVSVERLFKTLITNLIQSKVDYLEEKNPQGWRRRGRVESDRLVIPADPPGCEASSTDYSISHTLIPHADSLSQPPKSFPRSSFTKPHSQFGIFLEHFVIACSTPYLVSS